MASFNFIVTSVAAVILIITLAYLAVNMSTASAKQIFPPTYNACPDGWTMNSTGICVSPKSGNVGSPPINANTKYVTSDAGNSLSIAPLDKAWAGASGLSTICSKRQWSNANNISWDGISNYNSC